MLVTLCLLLAGVLSANMSATTPVFRKGVTLAGDPNVFIQNNFAELQRILDAGAGVIGYNLPWFAATQPCPTCEAQRPSNPRDWNDPVYAASEAVQNLDRISNYIAQHGNGAFLMVITFGTPGWAACPGDPTGPAQPYYPPQNAADYGDFMYAMSERYRGTHVSNLGIAIGFVRDWIVYNEVNSPSWWRNTACNTANLDPVYYYGGSLNQAYTNVHHLPSSSGVRVLAGAFTSYHHVDYTGTPGLRISTSYTDWKTHTDNGDANAAWISPLDFVQRMHDYNLQFDAIALHPYAPRIYDNPLAQPPTGAVSLGNLSSMLSLLQSLWPNDEAKWHLTLTEYHQHSYYGDTSLGFDHVSGVPCPNYFCAQTSEANLASFLQWAYGDSGSRKPYVDYLIWTMWQNVNPYPGGIVRADLSDKNEGLGGNSVRSAFAAIQP
ncbi:MAG: hypothetical protein ACE14L_13380 [Terriglobales bacterium]